MTAAPTTPFRAERYVIGQTRDARPLVVEPIASANIGLLAEGIAAIGPWAHYKRTPEQLAARLAGQNDGIARFQLMCGGALAGAVLIWQEWLVGPNLQMLAVLPGFQRLSIGSCSLAWFEAEARAHHRRNIWLCVSAFNVGAIAVYRRHGFEQTAVLDNLLEQGEDEFLMRKKLVLP
jgi:ribosomal protein S18 acetylase RimI-like enzyme